MASMYLVGQSQLNIAHPGINTDAGHPNQRLWKIPNDGLIGQHVGTRHVIAIRTGTLHTCRLVLRPG